MRRKRYLAAAAVTLAAALGVGMIFLRAGQDGQAPAKPAPPTTADITRGDLVDTASVDGKLTFAAERDIVSRVSGTVTGVPAEGRVIEQGDALLRVDHRPVTLLYGRLPLYRTLRQGIADGPDVRQLEQSLKALGYGTGMTVDKHFSWATAKAVRAWQKKSGLEKTGAVDATQAVFLPSKVRIAESKVFVGQPVHAGQQALTTTSTERVVHVDLDADHQDLVKKGRRVELEFPGGTSAKGRITHVGTVARTGDSAGTPAGTGTGGATIDVEIQLVRAKKTGLLDQAPVTVTLESERRKDVLSVPFEALLALREGGFGVELVESRGARRIVGVETGAYGGGRVEISGPGLAAGIKVGVPAE
jgi:peptidoglycan hydrolase-like protein with peptidoglycan-binding domain